MAAHTDSVPMQSARNVVDEVGALEATAQALEAVCVVLQTVNVGGARGVSMADNMHDSDSEDDVRPRHSRPRTTSMKRAQASAMRVSSARLRNDQAIRAELESTPRDPRLPPLQHNVERLRTSQERDEAISLVASCIENKSSALALRMRARTATDVELMTAVLDVLTAATHNIMQLAGLGRVSYQHVLQRALQEMISCDQRAAALASPGFSDPASVPNTSLATASASNPVPTGDGSDFDSSAPNTPRAVSGSNSDDESSTTDLSSSLLILARAKGRQPNEALGTASDIEI